MVAGVFLPCLLLRPFGGCQQLFFSVVFASVLRGLDLDHNSNNADNDRSDHSNVKYFVSMVHHTHISCINMECMQQAHKRLLESSASRSQDILGCSGHNGNNDDKNDKGKVPLTCSGLHSPQSYL